MEDVEQPIDLVVVSSPKAAPPNQPVSWAPLMRASPKPKAKRPMPAIPEDVDMYEDDPEPEVVLVYEDTPMPQGPSFTLPPGPPPGLTLPDAGPPDTLGTYATDHISAPSSPMPPSSLSPMDELQSSLEADFGLPRPTLNEAYAVWKDNMDDMVSQYNADSEVEQTYREVHGASSYAWEDTIKQFDKEQIQSLADFKQRSALRSLVDREECLSQGLFALAYA